MQLVYLTNSLWTVRYSEPPLVPVSSATKKEAPNEALCFYRDARSICQILAVPGVGMALTPYAWPARIQSHGHF